MKERLLTESHYNYANKFVKILGFDDLADYGRQVGYTVLKESQDLICVSLNKTLDVFKALFPQDGFNLRKIHYKFENIDQVLGFFKKVMVYLGIPHETIRVRGAYYLRLIPQKTSLYNEYIYRMQKKREMPLNSTPEPVGNTDSISNKLLKEPNSNNCYQLESKIPSSDIVITPWCPPEEACENTNLINPPTSTKFNEELLGFKCWDPSKDNSDLGPWSLLIPSEFQAAQGTPLVKLDTETNSEKNPDSYPANIFKLVPEIKRLHLPLDREVDFSDPEARLPMCNPVFDKELDGVSDGFVPKSNRINDCIRFSAILKKEDWPVVKIYLTGPDVNLSNFKEFGYISSIEIFGLEGTKLCPLQQGTEIIALIHDQIVQKQIVSSDFNPEPGSGFMFNLDFPNSFFYIYHELKLKIQNTRYNLFKINMKGKNFLGKYPTNKFIITDHDPKYYDPSRGYEWRIAHGMCGCSRWDESRSYSSLNYDDILKGYFDNNQVIQLKEVYPYPNPTELNGIEIDNKDNLNYGLSLGLSLLITWPKYYKPVSEYFFVIFNAISNLKFSFIVPDSNSDSNSSNTSIHSLYYPIKNSSDAIAKIEIPDGFSFNYQVTMSLFDGSSLVPVGTFDQTNRSIRFDKFYYLLPRVTRDVFLIIQVPNSELYQWLQVNLIFGEVFLDTQPRRQVAQNPGPI
jgi:hypothetical protein